MNFWWFFFKTILISTVSLSIAALAADETTTTTENPENDVSTILKPYELGKSIVLNCTLSTHDAYTIEWRRNKTIIEESKTEPKRIKILEGGRVLNVTKGLEEDYGYYSCKLKDVPGNGITWSVVAQVIAKLSPNSNAVEGQKTKFSCKLIGKPFTAVTWTYNNTMNNVTRITGNEEEFELQPNDQGAADAVLIIKSVTHEHAGSYGCHPDQGTPAYTLLRVKGVNAALWPFLGICAEVLLLCAIILFYEKRRTKLEPDDSDTDNNDQKKS